MTMTIPKPLTKTQAPAELHKIYDALDAGIGKVPNLFGVIARFPAAMKTLIQFYDAVMNQGKIAARYKELAYLKTSSINACRY
jgi:alkylhydroperoxidase family enzyme